MENDTLTALVRIFRWVNPNAADVIIDRDTRLSEDLRIDSIMLLMMALSIEEEMGIRFENLRADSFTTVGDVCDYIERKRA